MTLAMALASAPSVEGLMGMNWSALAAVSVKMGSMTMSLAPRSLASRMGEALPCLP